MNIKPVIYENLTTQERIIATFEALARDDEKEKNKLIKTCPKKTYDISDYAYSGKMEALHYIAMAVECEMRGYALNRFMLLWLEDNASGKTYEKLEEVNFNTIDQIEKIMCVQQAWHELLEEEGINPDTAIKAFRPTSHFGVSWILEIGSKIDISLDPEIVKAHKNCFGELLEKIE